MRTILFLVIGVLSSAAIGGMLIADGKIAAQSPDEADSAPATLPVQVGQAVDAQRVHLIERPGLYGLGPQPSNSQYAVVNSTLVRIDPAQMIVQSVIRPSVQPLD